MHNAHPAAATMIGCGADNTSCAASLHVPIDNVPFVASLTQAYRVD